MLLHFLCSGREYKESKMEKSAYCGLGAKIPGAGGGSWRRAAPALRGSCMDLDLHHLTGSFCLRRGCVASRGGFPVVRGTGRPAGSRYLRLGGRPAGSRYLRWGASCRKSLPPFGGASCRKLLPPFGGRPAGSRYLRLGGRPAGSRYLRLGASCRKSLPPLGGVPPEVVTSVWGGVLPEVATSVGGASRRKGFLCLERALPDRVISSSARCP